jgi:hypothetical protein
MGYLRLLMIVLLANQACIMAALAEERAILRETVAVIGQKHSARYATKDAGVTPITPLDRIAIAVDGAESSHGRDIAMWRPDPSGPQGPMQVSAAAAADIGGGDRFDLPRNREIGRAYLARLYRRYKNWPDAIAAYNWGLGNVDAWIKAGRPHEKLLTGVATYTNRVLYDSGLCYRGQTTQLRESAIFHDEPRLRAAGVNPLTHSIFAHFDGDAGTSSNNQEYLCGPMPSSFSNARSLHVKQSAAPFQSQLEQITASARRAWRIAIRSYQMNISPNGATRADLIMTWIKR